MWFNKPMMQIFQTARARLCFAMSILALLSSGCVATDKFLVANPVGPPAPGVEEHPGQGSLVVYSAWDGLDTFDPDHEKHTSYRVHSADGGLIRSVRNRCGSFDGYPMTVNLPTGTYKVEARATNFGWVFVPVRIEANRTTVVYLDGTEPPERELIEEALVRLPNGQIVGRRARDSSQ